VTPNGIVVLGLLEVEEEVSGIGTDSVRMFSIRTSVVLIE